MPEYAGATDFTGYLAEEVPTDIGWAIVVLHADHTITRTCKGCGLSFTHAMHPRMLGIIVHGADCPIAAALEANDPP